MAKSNRLEDKITRRKAVAARPGVRLLTQAEAYLQQHPVSAECVLWLLYENRRLVKSQTQRKAAHARHAETNEMKGRAISFYLENKGRMSKKEAAKAFTRLEPVKFRTVKDDWLKGL